MCKVTSSAKDRVWYGMDPCTAAVGFGVTVGVGTSVGIGVGVGVAVGEGIGDEVTATEVLSSGTDSDTAGGISLQQDMPATTHIRIKKKLFVSCGVLLFEFQGTVITQQKHFFYEIIISYPYQD